jgi:hypothetical protein
MDQVSIKYTNIFQCKTLQNFPNLDFWFENKPSGNPAEFFGSTRFFHVNQKSKEK